MVVVVNWWVVEVVVWFPTIQLVTCRRLSIIMLSNFQDNTEYIKSQMCAEMCKNYRQYSGIQMFFKVLASPSDPLVFI